MINSPTVAMVREHRWAYSELATAVFAASLLAGSSLALRLAADDAVLSRLALGRADLARAEFDLESARLDSGFMVGVAVVVGLILVGQTMISVVEGRRREFAQMRLVGAMPRQIVSMVLRETLLVTVLSSAAGGAAALLLVRPYAHLLGQMGDWPQMLKPEIHPSAVLWCVGVMALVGVVGALLTSRRIAHGSAYDAVQQIPSQTRRMPVGRWVLVGLGAVPVVVLLVLPARSIDFTASAALVGGGAVLAVAALSPAVVPLVGRLLAMLLMPWSPGAGLVARESVARNSRRTAALATPIIVLLGMGAVFAMTAQTVKAAGLLGLEQLHGVEAVVEAPEGAVDESDAARAAQSPGTDAMARLQRASHWSWGSAGSVGSDPTLDLLAMDVGTVGQFFPLDVTHGDLADVGGTNVAAFDGTASVGDTREIVSPDGTTLDVTVVAVIQSDVFVHGDLVLDPQSFPLELGATEETWFVAAAPGVDSSAVTAALWGIDAPVHVYSRDGWIDQQIASGVETQRLGILTIIGGAALLTIVSLAHSTVTSARERRRELRLLTTIGARRRSVIGAVIFEGMIVTMTAALLAGVITAAVYLRLQVGLDAAGLSIAPVIPRGALVGILVTCALVVTGAASVGSRIALGRPVTGNAAQRSGM
ncbi:MAG: ABC transporter permease [Brachybacterium sp.]|uniref:ABC transporter permease n=1 Tax=Brachybacterium sp. TaxID=1891286 RepID=UPI0026473BB2|nr:ABC transporter permease [Brachybacterium sp.]MDN5688136.1 ABC transporter permease [Brachybacterium sp.]